MPSESEISIHSRERDQLRADVLLEISKLAPSGLEEVYRMITGQIGDLLKISRTSFWTYNSGLRTLQCEDLYIREQKKHIPGNILFEDNFPVYFEALRQSRYVDASDSQTDRRTSEFLDLYLGPLNIISMLDIPVRSEGMLAGVLCCETVGEKRMWTQEDIDFTTSISGFISSFIHTDKLKKTEKALKSSEEKYRKIIENSLVAIYHSNLKGEFIYTNQAMIEMFEFDNPDDIHNYSVEQLYPSPDDRQDFVTRLLKQKTIRNMEMHLITKKGNPRMVLLNAFLDNDMIFGMLMDITDRKKDEEAIKLAKVKAEESDRMKTSLLANMSHEFRTPMNAILGFSDLIANESNDPDIAFFARKIHTSGHRLMGTLKAILDLADLEATRSKIKIQDIFIENFINDCLQHFSPTASEKGLYLITEYTEGLYVKADEVLLQLILNNLIENAIKFTRKGGITVETDIDHSGNEHACVIRIKDTGIGIPDDQFEMIFHEFRQISEGYNRSYEGTGLGLTLALKMAEMLEGKITVESELGLGSIFSLWLPVSECNQSDSFVKSKDSFEKSPSRVFKLKPPEELPRLLVVEDNDDNAEIIKLYVKGRFFTDRAADASTAIKMVKEKHFSGILMDINLGAGMDGLKASKAIRQINEYHNIPIIAITGYTMAGDREKILAGGCTHYLGKPFSQQELIDLLSEIFE